MSKYTCDNCQTGFTSKKLLTAHNKECKPKEAKPVDDRSYLKPAENTVIFEYNDADNDAHKKSKERILKLIDKAHNILYHAENISGEEALNDIMNFLFIKLLSTILSDKEEDGKIDLLNKKYYEQLYEDEDLNTIFGYFKDVNSLSLLPLDELRSMKENNDAIRQMGEILKTHPITGMVYIESNFINARKSSTIQQLLSEVINKIDINEFENNEDMIGDIYEFFINGYIKKGSQLGQFFTPRNLMKIVLHYKDVDIRNIVKLINKKDKIKLYDSCMGTAGWLVAGFNMLKDKYEKRLLLSGGEVKPSTFQYGLMNLISTLKMKPHNIVCDSSLTHIDNNKYHFILTNPPFQTGKKFTDVKDNFNTDKYNKMKLDDVYKLQNNNPPIQFLELNLYKLEENGMCIIVLPYGELFSGSKHSKARDYFMKQTNITDIITMPSGVFAHTGIKTAVIVFTKDNTGTKAINFIEANDKCNKLIKIMTVSIDDINKQPNKSWFVNDYIKEEVKERDTNVEYKKLGDVCEIDHNLIKHDTSFGKETGKFKFHTGGERTDLYVDEPDIKELYIIQNRTNGSGRCNLYIDNNFSLAKQTIAYKSKVSDNSTKYIYYYLKNNIKLLEDGFIGSSHKNISKEYINNLQIPIPSIERQNELVKHLDLIYEKNIKVSNDKINSLKELNKLYIDIKTKDIECKQLGDVVNIKLGTRVIKSESEIDSEYSGNKYPCYGGGNISFYMKEYNREGLNLIISRFGVSENCVRLIDNKFWLNDSGMTLHSNNNELNQKYLNYYLLINQNNIYSISEGTAQKNINMDKFKNLQIPIPSIEVQNEIVKYCDRNNNIIKLIEEEIEDNKVLASSLLKF